ncbi:5-oxoprolinase subunit PxpB [Vibrio sp. ZSDZ34]|uniref:5-oxoprolinase subunit PxpB n=1 Tax=Vibrio gelatinilyticus TaxID=2893468 RepID=A0A9X1WET7_9VIBR|nr:5-oxoprolinase subunit PxpB [Vibrio gelatinilyticus]MCJ2375689.1 5-oxoprolinase subunit PxpB [Vibrio gelatinilyticus]
MPDSIAVVPVSESALIIYFDDHIDLKWPAIIKSYQRFLQAQFTDSIRDCVASYTSLLVDYHPLKTGFEQIKQAVLNFDAEKAQLDYEGKLHRLPVCYHESVAPDLNNVAKLHQLTTDQVIDIHSKKTYTVCAVGFAPGFAFLAQVDGLIATPRHATPRKKIPVGSVGIADSQTAVYPLETPGGWQIIGNCPIELYNKNSPENSLLQIGDRVQFFAIHLNEYQSMGGRQCMVW